MSEQEILESLRGMEFFQGIGDEHLKRLAAISRLVAYPAHADIFREHEVAEDIFAIVEGKVSLAICTPKAGCRQLMEATAGDLIGWSPIVERARLTDTARSVTPTKAIAINGQSVLRLCEEDTEFGFQFIRRVAKVLANRLAATRLVLLDISGVRLPEFPIESD